MQPNTTFFLPTRQRLSMIEPGAGGRYFDGTRGVPSYLLKPQIEDSSESESSHPRHIKPRPPPGESPIREVAARYERKIMFYYDF